MSHTRHEYINYYYHEYCPIIISEDLQEQMYGFEDPVVYKYRYNGKFWIIVYSSPSWKTYEDGKPYLYFKIYISHKKKKPNFDFDCLVKSTKMYRISMYEADYIFAKDNGIHRYLSKGELKELLAFFNQYPEWWNNLIRNTNENHEIDSSPYCGFAHGVWKDIPGDFPMPDYSKLPTRN